MNLSKANRSLEIPIINSGKFVLEPFSDKFMTEKYISWLNNKNIVKFSEQRHYYHTKETCISYFQTLNNSTHFMWAILGKDEKIHIGNVNVHIDINNSIADIGILIGDISHWGKGLGTDVFIEVIKFLFFERNIRKITAGCIAENKGMINVLLKLGMKEDGVRKNHHLLNGKEVDIVYMCLFNKNFSY